MKNIYIVNKYFSFKIISGDGTLQEKRENSVTTVWEEDFQDHQVLVVPLVSLVI